MIWGEFPVLTMRVQASAHTLRHRVPHRLRPTTIQGHFFRLCARLSAPCCLLLLSLLLGLTAASAQARSKKPPKVDDTTPSSHSATGATDTSPPATASTSPSGPTGQAVPATASTSARPASATPTTAGQSTTVTADPPSTPAATRLAKGEVDAAKAQAGSHFQAGRYRDAAELLLRVYDADAQPIYLFNAGQAFRKGDLPLEAKTTYERFLSVAPDHKLAPEVRGYVKDMDALLATQAKAREISLELDKEKAEAQFARQALLQERTKPVYKRPLFWVLLGAGVLVTATVVGVLGWSVSVSRSDLGTQTVRAPPAN